MDKQDNKYMKEALKEAQKSYNKEEIPVGAVIVKDGKIIYDTPYARRLYEGIGFNFKTEKHPGACARWLEVGMAFNYSAIKWQMDEAIKKRLKEKQNSGGGKVRL